MALFNDKSNERRPDDDRSTDSPPLEPGEAALTQEDVHSRADAVETAATRPLPTTSGDSNEPLGARDNLQGAREADKDRLDAENKEAQSKSRRDR